MGSTPISAFIWDGSSGGKECLSKVRDPGSTPGLPHHDTKARRIIMSIWFSKEQFKELIQDTEIRKEIARTMCELIRHDYIDRDIWRTLVQDMTEELKKEFITPDLEQRLKKSIEEHLINRLRYVLFG